MGKRTWLFLLLCFNSFTILLSQKIDYAGNLDNYMAKFNQEKRSQSAFKELGYDDIQGNAFLPREFMTGKIYMTSGDVFTGPLRYNLYTGDIEFQTQNRDIYLVNEPRQIDHVEIGKRTYQYVLNPDNKNDMLFMELLFDGDHKVFLRKSVEFREAEPPQPYSDPKPARFSDEPDKLYIAFPDLSYVKISSRRSLLKTFEKDTEKLKEFIKKNDLKVDDPDDLVLIVKFIEEE